MARQAITIAGTIVGAAFGAPQLGFAIGSLIGNAVDPVQVQGPKIGDLQVQTSRDGVPRPIVFGVAAVAGNIIDRSEPKIVKKKERAGKGGPVTVTERVYMSFAVRICEGPATGISRVWENEKLVYDGRAGSEIPQDSVKFLEKVTFYYGEESQMPDPTLEAIHGVGNVPAHRGTCYAVFANKDLTDFGGAIPQYRFEVNGLVSNPDLGGTWLVTESVASASYTAPYALTPWTSQPNDVTFGIKGTMFDAGNGYLYLAESGYFHYCLKTDLSDWTPLTLTGVAGNADMASDGTYLYIASGSGSGYLKRLTLPFSTITEPSSDSYSRGDSVACIGGRVVVVRDVDNRVAWSTDAGGTWTLGANPYSSIGVATSGARLRHNGSRLACAFHKDGVGVQITYTDDYGDSWSAVAYTVPSSVGDEVKGFGYTGTHWVLVTLAGKTAYSTDGASWTAGATIPKLVTNVAFASTKILAGTEEIRLYESTDFGASWTEVTGPVATGTAFQFMSAYWIPA